MFKPPSLCTLSWQPWQTNTPSKKETDKRYYIMKVFLIKSSNLASLCYCSILAIPGWCMAGAPQMPVTCTCQAHLVSGHLHVLFPLPGCSHSPICIAHSHSSSQSQRLLLTRAFPQHLPPVIAYGCLLSVPYTTCPHWNISSKRVETSSFLSSWYLQHRVSTNKYLLSKECPVYTLTLSPKAILITFTPMLCSSNHL